MWRRVALDTNTFRGLTNAMDVGHTAGGYRVGPKDVGLDLVDGVRIFKCRSFLVGGHEWVKVTWSRLDALFVIKITDICQEIKATSSRHPLLTQQQYINRLFAAHVSIRQHAPTRLCALSRDRRLWRCRRRACSRPGRHAYSDCTTQESLDRPTSICDVCYRERYSIRCRRWHFAWLAYYADRRPNQRAARAERHPDFPAACSGKHLRLIYTCLPS